MRQSSCSATAPKRVLMVVGAVFVAAGLAVSSLAVAAPRPSGTVVSSAAVAVEEPAGATAAVFTRSDMPRPSGNAAVWLEVAGVAAVQNQTGPTKLPTADVAAQAPVEASEEAAEDDWWTADMDCAPCHATEDLIAATAESVTLTDDNGTVVNPHDLPAVADHEGVLCSTCHKGHELSESIARTAQRACISCHHAYVYSCYTCHS